MGDISPTSPGTRRRSLPVQRRSVGPLSSVHRPDTVPAGACRGSGHQRASERDDTSLTEARTGDLSALEEEEWVKAAWKKGERREEIKLIAEASGLAFDDARIVVRVGQTSVEKHNKSRTLFYVPRRCRLYEPLYYSSSSRMLQSTSSSISLTVRTSKHSSYSTAAHSGV